MISCGHTTHGSGPGFNPGGEELERGAGAGYIKGMKGASDIGLKRLKQVDWSGAFSAFGNRPIPDEAYWLWKIVKQFDPVLVPRWSGRFRFFTSWRVFGKYGGRSRWFLFDQASTNPG